MVSNFPGLRELPNPKQARVDQSCRRQRSQSPIYQGPPNFQISFTPIVHIGAIHQIAPLERLQRVVDSIKDEHVVVHHTALFRWRKRLDQHLENPPVLLGHLDELGTAYVFDVLHQSPRRDELREGEGTGEQLASLLVPLVLTEQDHPGRCVSVQNHAVEPHYGANRLSTAEAHLQRRTVRVPETLLNRAQVEMHQIGRRPQAGLLRIEQLRAPQPLPATLPLGYPQPLPALDIDLGSGRRVSAPIGVYYLPVASNHASVVGPKGELAALLETQVRHDVESAHLTP